MITRRRSLDLSPNARVLALALSFVTVPAMLAPALGAPVAHAQDDEYRHTVEQALAEFDGGNFAESLALFRRAHAMRPSARTFRGLGKASFELRRYVDAVNYFGEALASTVNPLTEEQRTEVEALLSRAEAFVGRYAVSTEPETAAVAVDGNDVTHELVLDIGEHTITASAEGFATATRRITVAGGEDDHITMRLESSTAEVVVEERIVERVRTDPGEPFRIAGWAIGGVGVAGLVLGAVFHGVGYDAFEAFRDSAEPAPGRTVFCNADGTNIVGGPGGCEALFERWHTFESVRDVGYVTGSILVGAGLVFLIIGYVMEPHESAPASPAAARDLDVARGIAFVPSDSGPSLSLGCGPFAELGMACTGRF